MNEHKVQTNREEIKGPIFMHVEGAPHWPEGHAERVHAFINSELENYGLPAQTIQSITYGNGRLRTTVLFDLLNQQVNIMPKNPDTIQIALDALQYGIQVGATITDKQEIKEHIKNYLSNLK